MTRKYDLTIIGSGPAGMSAAIRASSLGLKVLVIDEQQAPGGQIWRAVEAVADTETGKLLGDEYRAGQAVAQAFRRCGAEYQPNTQVWQLEPGWHIYMSSAQKAEIVQADNVLLATGAQERPAPFPGWTLPGVMTVGAAQITLKVSQQIPTDPVWIAGSGPLVLLYMTQLLKAGGKIAGWLDTAPASSWRRGMPHFLAAMGSWRDMRKGYQWIKGLQAAKVPILRGVRQFRAEGEGRLTHVEYESSDGATHRVPARLLLVHEGVVPSIHITRSLECTHTWLPAQACMAPNVDTWGQTSQAGVFAAGDATGIGGARAAQVRGEIAAIGVALCLKKISEQQAEQLALPLRKKLDKELAIRPMLDAMYPPDRRVFQPSDDTIVCRCEELTAGDIRAAAKIGKPGPNQIKSITRAGMGPCQGRQCGYTIAHILAAEQKCDVSEVGFYRIRPPLKPLTLGELASLDIGDDLP